jgi:bifunctional non-homologous end joining protein LigD
MTPDCDSVIVRAVLRLDVWSGVPIGPRCCRAALFTCNPTVCKKVPSGPNWVHEIKYDGYRLIVRQDATRVRVFTRRGFDWTHKYPAITVALKLLRVRSVTMDGEGVYCGEDGISNFDQLHSEANNHHVFLYAFDLLELNGEDLRAEPLERRKGKFETLLGPVFS